MADEPSIDEILASLDSLLEETDIGNDEPARPDAPRKPEERRPEDEDVPRLELTPPAPPPQIELTADQLLEDEADEAEQPSVPAAQSPSMDDAGEAAHHAPPPAAEAEARDAPAREEESLSAEAQAARLMPRIVETLARELPGVLTPLVRRAVEQALREAGAPEKPDRT